MLLITLALTIFAPLSALSVSVPPRKEEAMALRAKGTDLCLGVPEATASIGDIVSLYVLICLSSCCWMDAVV